MTRTALAAVLILLLAPATHAVAQSAVSCDCYCGITTSPPCSEQACKSACGWTQDGRGGGQQSGPTRLWYCRAVTGKGGAGWAWSPDLDTARQSALNYCRKYGRCTIEACRVNDPSLARAPSTTRAPVRGPGPTPRQQGWCELCTRKLQADVRAGWASALIRSYVGQAIAGYQNCKRMAPSGGSCPAGDRLAAALRQCGWRTFAAYRACIDGNL